MPDVTTTSAVEAISKAAKTLPTEAIDIYQWSTIALGVAIVATGRLLVRCYGEKTKALVERAMALRDATTALNASTEALKLTSETSLRLGEDVRELRRAVQELRAAPLPVVPSLPSGG